MKNRCRFGVANRWRVNQRHAARWSSRREQPRVTPDQVDGCFQRRRRTGHVQLAAPSPNGIAERFGIRESLLAHDVAHDRR